MSSDRFSFSTEIMIEVVMFYIGVALFIGLCMIPPISIMLPHILPMTFLICIIVNISFIIRFSKGTNNELKNMVSKLEENINLDLTPSLDDIINNDTNNNTNTN